MIELKPNPQSGRSIMATFGAERVRNEVILAARILLIALFVVFGWRKLADYSGTVGYMAQIGAPMPSIAALVAIVVEVFVALAVALGIWTRPLALLMALYTFGTALIGHPFWEMEGADRYANAINFYKNFSIIGGFLLLYVTGPGRYSLDAILGARPGSQVRSI
jgi:putative oxidoreductase